MEVYALKASGEIESNEFLKVQGYNSRSRHNVIIADRADLLGFSQSYGLWAQAVIVIW